MKHGGHHDPRFHPRCLRAMRGQEMARIRRALSMDRGASRWVSGWVRPHDSKAKGARDGVVTVDLCCGRKTDEKRMPARPPAITRNRLVEPMGEWSKAVA